MVYTALLNERGGFESDLTITRLGVDSFLGRHRLGPADPRRRLDLPHIGRDEAATLADVSALTSVLSVMGPSAKELLCRVGAPDTRERLAPERLPFSSTTEIDVGFARVRAARMSYVGGPGFELYVPSEMARHVYLALHEAGADLGLADAGYYALDALRIEAGRRAWGAELGPDETPFEAGTLFAVKLDKPTPFLGRDALLARRTAAPAKRLVSLVFDSAEAWAWGGEALLLGGAPAARSPRPAGVPGSAPASPSATCAARPPPSVTPARRSRSTSGACGWRPPPGTKRRGCSARPGERRADTVLAALDRGAGVRAVAAVRHRRGRDPAGDRAQRARPGRLGRAGRARGHPDRHRLAGVEPAGVDHHHPLRRALGDRRRERLVRPGDGDLHGGAHLAAFTAGVFMIGMASAVYNLARQSYLTEAVPFHYRAAPSPRSAA
jgi:glycine cleavage system aminomethyltransferase T